MEDPQAYSYKIDTIYFDYMKAFDTVPHERLLHKLKGYGMSKEIIEWIRDFITGRRQKVKVNGAGSSWANVTSGVPQGSILGPLLFILFINELPMKVDGEILLFADDTKLFHQVESRADQQSLQKDIDTMFNWSVEWDLTFHPDKCKGYEARIKQH